MTAARAYAPPPLNPLQARFCNALLTRDLPRGFDLHGKLCSFAADPWQPPFVPACGLTLDVRGETWQALFSSSAPMALHPAGACLAGTPELPEGLRLALFELSLAPVCNALSGFFGLDTPPAILAEDREILREAVCVIPLALHLPGETVAVSIRVPGRETAETLLHRLNREKRATNPVPPLFLAAALEAGSMRLTVAELLALHPEDILLPEAYLALEGKLRLRLAPDLAVYCAVSNGAATVTGIERVAPRRAEHETRREEMPDTPPNGPSVNHAAPPEDTGPAEQQANGNGNAARPESVDPGSLEVEVTFELDRRLMSIAEITALAPGYTFALPADPSGPVTVRVNGKRLGTGRLVTIGDALGVQLIGLEGA